MNQTLAFLLLEHELIRKPVSTFRDHALAYDPEHLLARIDEDGTHQA
jgi:hypothetical protein